jgi:hypothetical protein
MGDRDTLEVSAWIGAVCALIVVAVSVLFSPIAAIAMLFGG